MLWKLRSKLIVWSSHFNSQPHYLHVVTWGVLRCWEPKNNSKCQQTNKVWDTFCQLMARQTGEGQEGEKVGEVPKQELQKKERKATSIPRAWCRKETKWWHTCLGINEQSKQINKSMRIVEHQPDVSRQMLTRHIWVKSRISLWKTFECRCRKTTDWLLSLRWDSLR